MDILREKIHCAAMELKIAIFCSVIMGLSYIYRIIEPLLGEIIYRISIVTFCASLTVFTYKVVFGTIGAASTIILISLYISAIGGVLDEPYLFRGGLSAALLCVAGKTFIWIFMRGKDIPEDESIEQSDDLSKSK